MFKICVGKARSGNVLSWLVGPDYVDLLPWCDVIFNHISYSQRSKPMNLLKRYALAVWADGPAVGKGV